MKNVVIRGKLGANHNATLVRGKLTANHNDRSAVRAGHNPRTTTAIASCASAST